MKTIIIHYLLVEAIAIIKVKWLHNNVIQSLSRNGSVILNILRTCCIAFYSRWQTIRGHFITHVWTDRFSCGVTHSSDYIKWSYLTVIFTMPIPLIGFWLNFSSFMTASPAYYSQTCLFPKINLHVNLVVGLNNDKNWFNLYIYDWKKSGNSEPVKFFSFFWILNIFMELHEWECNFFVICCVILFLATFC